MVRSGEYISLVGVEGTCARLMRGVELKKQRFRLYLKEMSWKGRLFVFWSPVHWCVYMYRKKPFCVHSVV